MKKAYVVLTIASCMLAMTAAVAQHVPIMDPAECPGSCNGSFPFDPVTCLHVANESDPCVTTGTCPGIWPTGPYAPMPTWPIQIDYTNMLILAQDPIAVDLPATYDFCAWSDQLFCLISALVAVMPDLAEVANFASLVVCINMDLNGPLNTCLDIPVQSNGIPDRYELGLLAAVLNDSGHPLNASAVAAMQNNINELVNLIVDAVTAELGPTVTSIVQFAAPWLVPSLSGLLSGFGVLGDADTNAALTEMLGLLADIGITPPDDITEIFDSVPAIGSNGKVSGGAFTNREIYEWNIQLNPAMTVAEYVALCLNPATTVPAKVTISGGGTKLTGSDVTLAVNLSNVAANHTATAYVWYKWGLTGATVCKNPPTCDQTCPEEGWVVLPDETGSALTITAAQLTDSGQYAVEVTMDDGTKAVVGDIMAKTTLIVSDTSVPIGGALGLTLLAGACALAGAVGIRRRK